MPSHHLQTLGHLDLVGLKFGREKPLLLLVYLSLKGVQPRRSVAQLFWPAAANPLNSLSVAVAQLRKAAPDLIEASETQIRTELESDVALFLAALTAQDFSAAQALYQGPFLADLSFADLAEELEEWVMTTREQLAGEYRQALLGRARAQAPNDAGEAAQTAAAAYSLTGAAPLTASQLREVHGLLSAGGHPAAAAAAHEAQELGLHLREPQGGNGAALLGRASELARLMELTAGEALWVRGFRGLGKSALLQKAAARSGAALLVGQSGRPYQTLLPLLGKQVRAAPTTDEGWLRLLSAGPDSLFSAGLVLDDWEAADADSRRVLLRLAQSRAAGPLILSSRERSALGSGSGLSELLLRPLPLESLSAEDARHTGGIPALLAAPQHGQTLTDALATLLSPLSPQVRQVLACLALQDQPDPQVTRRALQLDPEMLAHIQETLGLAGLWQGGAPYGTGVAARPTVLNWLKSQPSLEAEVLMLLAPQLPPADALPLYLRAQTLTGSSELPGFQAALSASAAALLDTEQESEAERLLAAHARTPETWLLHARALDALGRGPEALKRLDALPLTPEVQAVRSLALWRTGRTEEARHAAQTALSGDLTARARGHMVLGALALSAQEYPQAKAAFSRACGLFRLLGDDLSYLKLLCQQAVAMTELADDLTATMTEIRMLSAKHPNALILNNIGWLLERQNSPEQALDFYRQAAQLAQTRQQAATAALAWNNVGTVEQQLGRLDAAEQAYQTAITHARLTGEIQTLAMVLGNLGELKESLPLIEEAIELLLGTGQDDLIAYFESQRLTFMARSGGI
ncbi:hypothetical protein EHF33_17950 (plasmid) [Deinococcus psychrotolerans]|uniref:Uncharacterized protein n=1 Tax=Deinococcus psychrotolerans TaxID=2489213 RepID=A0A3G8YQB3_9DEIO|nr:tetratricopeptide repeat protein [Deinococcus psychrotolerans]AZI44774.1 hypothetical protein EHF33_17950 [Deinococcus psychrotolerans]